MNNSKYLNGVLTVIAVCLVILTLSVIGVFPKANAASPNVHYVSVPVNKDGSIKVTVSDPMPIDIVKIAGEAVAPRSYGKPGAMPIR